MLRDIEMVAGEGFEPPKHSATDLQSAPFGRLGNPPMHMEGYQVPGPFLHANAAEWTVDSHKVTNTTKEKHGRGFLIRSRQQG